MIEAVFVTDTAMETRSGRQAASRAEAAGKSIRKIATRNDVPTQFRNRRTIVLDTHRGAVFGRCPGSRGHQCCNYRTVDVYVGCSIGCSYCIMNGYLNFAPMVVQVDVDHVVDRIRSDAGVSGAPIRVGSGEVGDSLLIDPVFMLNAEIIRGLADLPHVTYEMKSKTNYVDHLLPVEAKGGAVVAFSLNPAHVARTEEGIAATPEQRLDAALRCVEAGYHTAFHFDPIIRTDSFPDDYLDLISCLSRFPAGSIRWVSMGTLRYPPSLRDAILRRPYSRDEFVPGSDGKMRYLQPVRRRMYRMLWDAIRQVTDAPVYLCMESAAMWRFLVGSTPDEMPSLAGIFDVSGSRG